MMELTDQELLEHFLEMNSGVALEEILKRHGPLARGTCLRVLGNEHDADDAVQATFLVFAQKAASIRNRENLSYWFYRVALNCAIRLKKRLVNRREQETVLKEDIMQPSSDSQSTWEEMSRLLDEEMGRLAEKYQAPLVHCYLEGLSCADAAKKVGVGQKTLETRLSRARELLRQRLVRRGVTVSSVALGTLILQNTSSSAYALNASAIHATAQSIMASGIITGTATAAATGTISTSSIEVMKGVLQAMFLKKALIITGAIALAACLIPTTAQIVHRPASVPQPAVVNSPVTTQAKASATQANTAVLPVEESSAKKDYRLLANQAIKNMDRNAIEKIFTEWLEKDPKEFTGWVYQLPQQLKVSSKRSIIDRPYYKKAKKREDNEDSRRLSAGEVRDEALSLVAAKWMEQDPAFVYQWAQQLPAGNLRYDILFSLFKKFEDKDPKWAAHIGLQLPAGGGRRFELARAAVNWAERDPAAAAQFAQQLPEREERNMVLANVFIDLAQKDLESAAKLAKQFSAGDGGDEALQSVVNQWAIKDPLGAAQLALQLSTTKERKSALRSVAYWFTKKDPASAALWAQQLPAGDERNHTLQDVARFWAEKDPEAAASWARGVPHEAKGEVDRMVILAQVGTLAQSSRYFKDGLSILQEVPEKFRQEAQVIIAQRFSGDGNNQIPLNDWVKTLPAGKAKDDLIVRTLGVGERDLYEMERVSQMTDEKLRQKTFEWLFKEWVESDARKNTQKAKEWLENSSLPEATKAGLRTMAEKTLREQK